MTTATSQLLPGSDATDYTTVSFIVAAALANMQTVSVCEVVAVNTAALTVDIKVLVNLMTAAGQPIPHGVISGRPYFRLQGGGNAIICDPVVGDIGVVVFASRDLSGVIANKAAANPGSQRQFDWADGVYYGGILNGAPTQYTKFFGGSVQTQSPMLQTSGNASIGTGVTGTFPTPTGNVVTLQNGIPTSAGTPFNAAYFTNLTAQINAANTCAEIQEIATAAVGSLNDLTASITAQAAVITPALALLNVPTNPTAVVTWVSNFISEYLTPQFASYAAYVAQLAALATEAPTIIAAIAAAAANIGTCSITIPTFSPGSIPSPPSPPTYPPFTVPVSAIGASGVTAGSYTSANITVNAAGIITAAANGSGGGGGTVTSVGISTPGTGVVVGGGPITTAGTLTVNLSSTTYAALALAVTALQSISIATGTGLTGGPLGASGSTVALANTSVTPGSYTNTNITVDAQGRLTAASNGSGGGAALPGTIPDLVMWIETDNILGAAGATVNRLQEKTPWIGGVAAYPALAGTPAVIDSTQLNGLNVLKWTAASTAAYNMQPAVWLIGGCTYFFVGRGLNNTKTGSQALVAAGASNNPALYLSNGTGNQFVSLVNEGVAAIGTCTTAWVLNTFFQMNVTYNAATGAFAFRQGRAAANSGTGTTGVGAAAAMSIIGDDQFGSTLGASIAALIVYNRVLSPTEITNVENYLFAKWGV